MSGSRLPLKNIGIRFGKHRVPTSYAVVATVLISGIAAWFFWRPESLEAVGWKVVDCIHKGDGECLYKYSDKSERSVVGYNRESLIKYGRDYLAPAFASTTLSKEKKATALADLDWVLASRGITGSEVSSGIGVRVAVTSDGIKVPTLLGESFLAAAVVKYADPKIAQPERKIQAWLTAAQKDGPYLNSIGIRGVWQDADDIFYTWEDFIKKTEIQLEKTLAAKEAQKLKN